MAWESLAAGSASAQRSITSAPGWKDAVGTLVNGGALQVHCSRGSLPCPPARILSQSQGHLPRPDVTATPCVSKRPVLREPRPLALRERLWLTNRLPKESKVELIRRLEELDKDIPLYLRRRPSWVHEEDQPAAVIDCAPSRAADEEIAPRFVVESHFPETRACSPGCGQDRFWKSTAKSKRVLASESCPKLGFQGRPASRGFESRLRCSLREALT